MFETATPRPNRAPAPQPVSPAAALGPAPERIAPATLKGTARRTGYVLSWGVLALAAGAYLAAIVFKPQFLNDWLPSIGPVLTQPQGNDQNRSAAIAEVKKLRATLSKSQAEVARLRLELGDRDARVKAAELRISQLEKELQAARLAAGPVAGSDRPAETASITPASRESRAAAGDAESAAGAEATQRALASAIGAPQAVVPATDTAAAKPQSGSPRSFELVNGAIVTTQGAPETLAAAQPGSDVAIPLPDRKPAGVAPRRSSPIVQLKRPTVAVTPTTPQSIETGSVAASGAAAIKPTADKPAEPIRFGAPVVTRSAKPIGIRLTAGPSVDALRLSWSLMAERYGSELSGLQPRYVMGNTSAAPYALVAGPFTSDQDAQRVCGSLIAKGIPCSVDTYVGNAL